MPRSRAPKTCPHSARPWASGQQVPCSLRLPRACAAKVSVTSPENAKPVDLSWDDYAEAGGPGVAPDQEAAEGVHTTHTVN